MIIYISVSQPFFMRNPHFNCQKPIILSETESASFCSEILPRILKNSFVYCSKQKNWMQQHSGASFINKLHNTKDYIYTWHSPSPAIHYSWVTKVRIIHKNPLLLFIPVHSSSDFLNTLILTDSNPLIYSHYSNLHVITILTS